MLGHVAQLVVQPVEALQDLGALQPAVDVRRAPAHPERPERRPDREAEREREEDGQRSRSSDGSTDSWSVEQAHPGPVSGAVTGAPRGPTAPAGRSLGPGRGGSARSTITGAWSLAPLPARSSRSIAAPVTRCGERGRAEHEVDPHPAVPLEALPVVVPVGVDLRARVQRAHDVRVAGVDDRLERRPLRRGDVGALRELRDVEDVLVARGDVPVARQRDLPLRVVREPAGGRRRAGPRARPACSRGAGRRAPGRWARRATTPGPRCTWRRSPAPRRPAGRRTPACRRSHCSTSSMPDPADDRDAVPLVAAERRDVVPQRLAGPSSATGRRAPWSPAGRARRCRGAVRNASTRSIRERTEFTFQVAMRIAATLGPVGQDALRRTSRRACQTSYRPIGESR